MNRACLILLLFFVAYIGAANASTAPNVASVIFRQPISARALAIGDAFTGLTDDISAILYNPAGLAQLTSSEVSGMYSRDEITNISYGFFGFSAHFSDKCNLGLSGNARDDSTGGQNYAYTLSYALKLKEKAQVGVTTFGLNIRYMESKPLEGTEQDRIYSYVGDLGLLSVLYLAERPFGIGLCIQNFGGAIMRGDGVREEELLPLVGRFGLAYTFADKNTPVSICTDVTYVENDENPKYSAGMEWWITQGFSLRLGYKVNYDVDSLTAGFGLKYGSVRFDSAFVELDDRVGYTPKISFLCKF